MNDNDLERDLRSQRGPREAGYKPAVLPTALGDAPAPGATPSGLGRAGMFVGVAVAGALAVAVVAGILSGSAPDGIGSTGSATPSAGVSTAPSAGDAPCDSGDFSQIGTEPWGGAAGSRGTVVTITTDPAGRGCLLETPVAAHINDAEGALLVGGASADSRLVSLRPGDSFAIGLRWSNWCGSTPAAPLSVVLEFNGWSGMLPVMLPGGGVPPCSGSTQPSSLTVTDVQPRQ